MPRSSDQSAGSHGLLVDLHSHSRYSDGTATLEEIEAACQKRKIAVALTDHNEVRGSVKLASRARALTLPGIEVGTREGLEFLVYFADPGALEDFFVRSIEPYLLSRFMVRSRARSLGVIESAHDLGGYVSLAHPFAPGRKSIDFHSRKGPRQQAFITRVLAGIDAYERFNGGVLSRSNDRAAEFSLGFDKPITAGSDSHHPSSLGSCGIRYAAAATAGGADLFAAVAANSGTEVVTRQGKHFRTVPIIALKHTMFFVRGRQASRRKHH